MKKFFALLMVFILILCVFSACGDKTEPLRWADVYLGSIIPAPALEKSTLGVNFNDRLTVQVKDCSLSEYTAYLRDCEERGFTIDGVQDGIRYSAFNEEGYRLELTHYTTGDMSILLEAPMEKVEFGWPTSGPGAAIPATPSLNGNVTWNNEDLFVAYVADMSVDSYQQYVAACMDAGFQVDYRKTETKFSAQNSDGIELDIDYYGYNTVYISATTPEKQLGTENAEEPVDEMTVPETPALPEEPVQIVPSGDFKEMMDSYEKFFDEYIAFMKKYLNNPTDVTLLLQYGDFMAQYAEVMDKMNAVSKDNLSDSELVYYLEVTGRINKKLAEIL